MHLYSCFISCFQACEFFGVPNPLPFDITELVLVVLAFINALYGPKNINSN